MGERFMNICSYMEKFFLDFHFSLNWTNVFKSKQYFFKLKNTVKAEKLLKESTFKKKPESMEKRKKERKKEFDGKKIVKER